MPPASVRLSVSSTPGIATIHLKSCSRLCSPARAGADSIVCRETPGRYCSALIKVPGSPTLLARWRVQGNLNLDLDVSQPSRPKSFELPPSPNLRLRQMFQRLSWSRTLMLLSARVIGMTASLVLLQVSDTSILTMLLTRTEDARQLSTFARAFGVYTLISSGRLTAPSVVKVLLLTTSEKTMLLLELAKKSLDIQQREEGVV